MTRLGAWWAKTKPLRRVLMVVAALVTVYLIIFQPVFFSIELLPFEFYTAVSAFTGLSAWFAARAAYEMRRQSYKPLFWVGLFFVAGGFSIYDLEFPPLTIGNMLLHAALCWLFFHLAGRRGDQSIPQGPALRGFPSVMSAWDLLERKVGVPLPAVWRERLERLDKLIADRLIKQEIEK